MTKGRQWKAKLKSYENSSFNKDTYRPSSTSTAEFVTDKIRRLRIEQQRAEQNRQRRSRNNPQSDSTPVSGVVIYQSETGQQGNNNNNNNARLPLTAGPPPPPSWRTNAREVQREQMESVKNVKENRKKVVAVGDSSLLNQCACQAARCMTTKRNGWNELIPYLPVAVKQVLLQHISSIDGLDSILFDSFISFDYTDLCLEDARISFAKLCKAYWRVEEYRQRVVEEVEEWWEYDIEEEGVEEENVDHYVYSPPDANVDDCTSEDLDTKDERSSYLETVITDLLISQHHIKVTMAHSLLNTKSFSLFTPLSCKLTSLNISFAVNWPNISLAHLLVSTLPRLQQLRTAACFNATEGPRAITIISQGLRKLKVWDIGFHNWIRLESLCGSTCLVNWKRDLQELELLCLQHLHEGVSSQAREWLANESHGRIQVID
ncbi:unnamed protein product [Rhizopus microsporus]